jgi:DNA-directed RNA polymerase subunit alpha
MISLPNKPKVIKKEGNKAVFEIEALYPGYGVTVGNSLRRVLLSSLGGAAVTQVKIKGVSHEFSTIPGILEDVTFIMLNLKQLRFKIFTDEPQKATLKVKGEKEVKGSDFNLPSQVELVNKNSHIATLTAKSAELEMEIQIEKGIGYSPRERRAKEKLEIGAIPLDAIFTPVRRVSYKIENMRVGERTDYDRLFLEIETDGIISPEEAFRQTSEILVNHFSLFSETFKQEVPPVIKPVIKKKKPAPKKTAKKIKKTKKTKIRSSRPSAKRVPEKKKP